jgi:hypothetical protein
MCRIFYILVTILPFCNPEGKVNMFLFSRIFRARKLRKFYHKIHFPHIFQVIFVEMDRE